MRFLRSLRPSLYAPLYTPLSAPLCSDCPPLSRITLSNLTLVDQIETKVVRDFSSKYFPFCERAKTSTVRHVSRFSLHYSSVFIFHFVLVLFTNELCSIPSYLLVPAGTCCHQHHIEPICLSIQSYSCLYSAQLFAFVVVLTCING